jgi:hypothetical protein
MKRGLSLHNHSECGPDERSDVRGCIRSLVFFSIDRTPNFLDVPTKRGGDGSQVAQGRVARLCGAQGPAV